MCRMSCRTGIILDLAVIGNRLMRLKERAAVRPRGRSPVSGAARGLYN